MTIYLAGPILGCSDQECQEWRALVTAMWPGSVLDPMRRDYRGQESKFVREIVEGDKADIDQCHALLVNHPQPSVGTSMEILYAWERGKAVVVVVPQGSVVSPWLRYHSTDVVHSFEEAVALLITLIPGAVTR